MNESIVLSSDVLNTIKSLPLEQQFSIVSAIAGEMIMGAVLGDALSADERKLYAVIKTNVKHDSQLYACRMAAC